MKRALILFAVLSISLSVFIGSEALCADEKLPVVGGKPVLAIVNGEPLTLEEFNRSLASLHEGMGDNVARKKPNPSELLERLINVKLILQEAQNIGLDSLPEVASSIKSFEESALRDMLFGEQARKVKKPDAKFVDKLYKAATKELKVKSVLFEKEEDAKRMEAELKAGGNFEVLANQAVSSGNAKGELEAQYLKYGSMLAEVAAGVSSLKKGEVSAPIKIGKRYTLVKMEEVRYPKDPEARRKAEQEALKVKRSEAISKYVEGLKKKHAKMDEKLLESVDFDAVDTGIEKLISDERVLAKIKGENPVTVGELAKVLKGRFFHGPERAAQKQKINRKKAQTLDDMVGKRVVLKEAKARKLEKTEFFRSQVAEFRDGVLFGTFVQKAIDPDVKVTDQEIRAYMQEHIAEYTAPGMIRIDGIPFSARKDAETMLEKLRKGAEFQWAKTNADGRLDPKKDSGLLDFSGNLLMISELPEGARKAVSEASAGDYRMFGESEGPWYILKIMEIIPSRPQPFEAVAGDIENKVFLDKRVKALHEWEEKLRKASTIERFYKGESLGRVIMPHAR